MAVTARAVVAPTSPDLVRTARTTGLFYLALAVAGMLGFLLVRPALFVPDDPSATLARLVEHESLARFGLAMEMATVIAQALAALWFYRLFRAVDGFAAGAIAAFGFVNATAVLASAALLATALQVALTPTPPNAGHVQLMYLASANFWQVGNLFFGLWLIPMGWCVLQSAWMPRPLGWILVVGGAGYVLNPFVGYLTPGAGLASVPLVIAATVGEFWMIGYLLMRGVRHRNTPGPVTKPQQPVEPSRP
jgi:hypothetical protein